MSNILRELPTEELPREKLQKLGPEGLSSAELLAIILQTGTKNKNVLKLSRDILKSFPENLITRTTIAELESHSGVKGAKACQIVALFELTRRLSQRKGLSKLALKNSDLVFEYVKPDFIDLRIEKVMAIFVTSKNSIIKKEFIFEGGIDYSIIDIRNLVKRVLMYDASGFFLIHNHPSGDCTPSEIDIQVTQEIKNICTKLRIRFLDHLVIGDEYYSFADNGLLN